MSKPATRDIKTLLELQASAHPYQVLPLTDEEYKMLAAHNITKVNKVEPAKSSMEVILEERGSRYGSFSGHAFITQCLKHTMKEAPKWNELNQSQKEALEMVAHKIGRILNGDPNYLDSWVDIVGYTQLIVDQLNGKNT